ncbi:diguanylate cyclase, partial [Shigella sonnei]|nr:diguanylate cyclase [Shigella sonnei]
SVTSVLTLKQYAQKNLALTAATIVSASDIRR